MTLRDILKVKGSHVHYIGPDATVLDAVAILMEHRIGALLVRGAAGEVAGIITERDVLRECARHAADLGRIRVREAMTPEPLVCAPDDGVDAAMGIVTAHRVRHLPVMDAGRVAGMISIGDLVKAKLDEAQDENQHLREYITGR
ncbi:MAG TPA: CBS domain-containing protein [Candidatus Binatia bacterium]|nr:CBS domain-containing protein [Candidatus Binatia bacterium]